MPDNYCAEKWKDVLLYWPDSPHCGIKNNKHGIRYNKNNGTGLTVSTIQPSFYLVECKVTKRYILQIQTNLIMEKHGKKAHMTSNEKRKNHDRNIQEGLAGTPKMNLILSMSSRKSLS